MSRVDEALRQAEAVALVDNPADARRQPAAGNPADALRLEQYPAEARPQPAAGNPADASRLEHYPAETPVPQEARIDVAPLESLLADTPRPRETRRATRRASDWADKLVTSDRMPELAIEQYRRLAASLHDLQIERNLRTVMVTSALPQDGKTLTAANLALTLSESYARRVLLIDADLRHPSIGAVFSLPNSVGLREYLRSGMSQLPTQDVTARLRVLAAGRADGHAVAGLTSARMRTLIEEAESRYDWVILDTPPVGLLPDGQLLARLVRAVVFVIGAGATPAAVVEKAIAELGRDCIIGTVLNSVEEDAIPATGYYRKYYERDEFVAGR